MIVSLLLLQTGNTEGRPDTYTVCLSLAIHPFDSFFDESIAA